MIAFIILLSAIAASAVWTTARSSQRRRPAGVQAKTKARGLKLVPHRISLSNGKSFNLNLPEGFAISVAAQGLKRVRFMAKSPDSRIFVTDMYNLTDNSKGVVYVLDEFDSASKTFKKVTPYLTSLRNPNSVAFYTDQNGNNWLYLALTDRLLRYKYHAGDNAPNGDPEVLATFPDYGLSYKYGGWHLTRTIAVGGNGKIYVSVGSSCNACEEKEEVRASVLEMDPDGKNQRYFVHGLRNAVGLRWVKDRLFATNMGADHLGDDKPADTMYLLQDGAKYGWPYCYQSGITINRDPKLNPLGKKLDCRKIPLAYAAFDAHSSPLGFEYFDASEMGPVSKSGYGSPLRDSFLVALHGSTKEKLNRGYRVVRLKESGARSVRVEDFINGFLEAGKANGRPVDILRFGVDDFLVTDDRAGVIYYIYEE